MRASRYICDDLPNVYIIVIGHLFSWGVTKFVWSFKTTARLVKVL